MQLPVQDLIRAGAERTDRALERLLPSPDLAPHSLHRAVRHSTFAGGKRLRPTLCFEAWRLVAEHSGAAHTAAAENEAAAAELGAALEMLHTYSLIHDDLPALDNDDLRRGQPTCHKVFGEAIAILAGDALQTLAFATVARLRCPAETSVAVLREITTAIGTGVGTPSEQGEPDRNHQPADAPGTAPGMLGGQVLDIESEGQSPTAALVEQIHRAKTGALITASIVTGGLLAGASHEITARLRAFGENAGLAFQIIDDILDITEESAQLGKTAGKDTAVTKATWPAVFGVERARDDAHALITDAFAALEPFGPAADRLKSIARYLIDRKH